MTRLLFQSAGFGLFSNAVLAMILVAGVWSYFPPALTLGWLSALLAITAARVSLNAAFVARDRDETELPRWRAAFIAGVVAAGLAWGLAGWMFLNTSELLPRSLVVFIIAGMNAGAARSLASVRLSHVVYVVLTLGPVIVRCFVFAEPGSWTLSACAITYALFLLHTAHLHREQLRRLHQLNFENDALVEKLHRAKDRAEAGSRAKTEFLAGVSHEMRTPMSGILGLLHLLRDADPPPNQRERLDAAIASAESLLRLINDLVALARLESGAVRLEPRSFSPAEVVREVAALFAAPAATKRIHLAATVEPGAERRVVGDPARLREVLLKVVDNAVKFTDHGRVEVHASAAPDPSPAVARLRFRVSDTGIGLDPAARAHLFEKFSPGDASGPRRFAGLGLGLAVAQHLVRLMGGEISVVSQVGVGSTFTFELPLPLAPAG